MGGYSVDFMLWLCLYRDFDDILVGYDFEVGVEVLLRMLFLGNGYVVWGWEFDVGIYYIYYFMLFKFVFKFYYLFFW